MTPATADVVVVGGGPAGSAAAILFRRQGFSVMLLERAHMPRPKPCGESLSPETVPLLRRLGVLEKLVQASTGRLSGFIIYPYMAPAFRGTYAARCNGNPDRALGLAIPRVCLDTALLQTARDAGVVVREGWAVRDIGAWDGRARSLRVRRDDGAQMALEAPLVVGADGVHSLIATRLGLARPSTRLRQVAVVTHMSGVRDTGAYGEMHVMPHGYCGVAPLGRGIANVAIVVPATGVSATLRHAGSLERYFMQQLARFPRLANRLAGAEIVAGPWTTSGLARGVRRRVDDGVMLIGDAGGYFDPFTGEGIYRGLRSAELAARVGGRALRRGDTRRGALRAYSGLYARQFIPKRLVEMIVHEVIGHGRVFEHVATRLRRRPELADALMGVTGDFLSPYEVLSPWYLARLFA